MGKYTNEFKREVVNYYFSSQNGYIRTASYFGIERSSVRRWVNNYKKHGIEAINTRTTHKSYSQSFKMEVIRAVLEEGLSLRIASNQFNLSNSGIVSCWVSKYQKEGVESLQVKRRGRPPKMKKPVKSSNKPDNQRTQQELLDELLYLRAEIAYLKKLEALIQREQKQDKKPESSQD